MTVAAAARQGVTHARIALHPAELGGISIHLRATPEGLAASVIADHATAAHALQQGADELRRSLESQGLDLLSLDVGVADERRAGGAAAGQHGWGEEPRGGAAPAADTSTSEAAATGTVERRMELPNGVLVDVLA
jgi:flagellar hook-length control protein FliK